MGKDKGAAEIGKASVEMLKQLSETAAAAKTIKCEGKKGNPVIDTLMTCESSVEAFRKKFVKFCSAEQKLEKLAKKHGKLKDPLVAELLKIAERRSSAFFDTYLEKEAKIAEYIVKLRKVSH